MSLTDFCQKLVAEGRAVPISGTSAVEVLVTGPVLAAARLEETQRRYAKGFEALRAERRRREREAGIKQHREHGHFVFDCRR